MKQGEKRGRNNKIGAIGENVAEKYLVERNYTVLERNYLKKWGEIDIIAEKAKKIYFIEVKTVSYETKGALTHAVSYGTWRPEENVTSAKVMRMNRAIESWLEEQKMKDVDWQIDVAAVRIVPHEKYATIKYIENVIL